MANTANRNKLICKVTQYKYSLKPGFVCRENPRQSGILLFQQICAVLVLCALKNIAVNVQWGLAWTLNTSLKASVLAASIIINCFRKFIPVFHCPGKKAIFIYISPATSIYKFKCVVISISIGDVCNFVFSKSPGYTF